MKYFTFNEFMCSATAIAKGIDNAIPDNARQNIEYLVDAVLDPIREAWGKPITITSGYRCPSLNSIVGGSKTSQHLTGQAADISTSNPVDNRRLFHLILTLGLPFDQIIDESNFSWIHISHKHGVVNRRQILKL